MKTDDKFKEFDHEKPIKEVLDKLNQSWEEAGASVVSYTKWWCIYWQHSLAGW